ncbi:MAG: hypothetical protein L7F78_11320 [Syntrophales bacterium LBB04]|nr:hypothetical protein [Syntrophales bacterium LBB04]
MHIELLWLAPILALALFLLFMILYMQGKFSSQPRSAELHREVDLFNAGQAQQKLVTAKSADERLHEMERMINFVAEAVARERQPVQDVRRVKSTQGDEAGELREKLRSVFKEYDIILSENYTLRAKVKLLAKRIRELEDAAAVPLESDSILTRNTTPPKPAMRLYEDTRLISDPDSIEELDDELPESDGAVNR